MISKRILVVDDEPTLREVIQSCLEDLGGWQVVGAASGHEGLLKVSTYPPNAILVDWMMPEMDGFAFLHQLRLNPAHQTIPAIMMSGEAHLIDRNLSAQLGVVDVFAKPFDALTLVNRVAQALQWH